MGIELIVPLAIFLAILLWGVIAGGWGEQQQKLDKRMSDYSERLREQHELVREMRDARNPDGSFEYSSEDIKQSWEDFERQMKEHD